MRATTPGRQLLKCDMAPAGPGWLQFLTDGRRRTIFLRIFSLPWSVQLLWGPQQLFELWCDFQRDFRFEGGLAKRTWEHHFFCSKILTSENCHFFLETSSVAIISQYQGIFCYSAVA